MALKFSRPCRAKPHFTAPYGARLVDFTLAKRPVTPKSTGRIRLHC